MFFKKYIWGFFSKLRKDNVGACAAQAAYFTMLSFVPFMMLLLSLVQYVPNSHDYFMAVIERSMPEYLNGILVRIINELYSHSVTLVSVTAVVAVWTSAKSLQSLSNGLNAVYEIEETRNWFLLRFRAAINTVLMLLSIVGLLVLMIFGDWLQTLLVKKRPFIAEISEKILENRIFIMMIFLVIVFDIFYTVLPNRRATLLGQLPGAVICSICWLVFSWFVSIYINDFNGFSMYGSLTVLVLIMFWLYFCMYFIMVGGAINFYFNAAFRVLRRRLRAWKRRRRASRKQYLLEKKQEVKLHIQAKKQSDSAENPSEVKEERM